MFNFDIAPTPELLEKAAEIVEKRGKTSGMYVSGNGAVCTLGAIGAAAHDLPTTGGGMVQVIEYLAQMINPDSDPEFSYSTVVRWNDYTAKDKRYVTRLLRRAARQLRKDT